MKNHAKFLKKKITSKNAVWIAHYYQGIARDLFLLCRAVENTHQLTEMKMGKLRKFLRELKEDK